jgi:peptidoglycan/LPS O-acetylase OafA/YrhL
VAAVAGLLWLAIAVPANPRFSYLIIGGLVAFRHLPWRLPTIPLLLLFGMTTTGMLSSGGMFATLSELSIGLYALSLPLGYLTFCAVLKPDEISRAVLENRQLQWFGTISYSFYMWQNHVIFGLHQYWPDSEGWLSYATFAVVIFVVATIFSWLSYRVIELDAARFLRLLLLPKRPSVGTH